jgi:hypothetical protein
VAVKDYKELLDLISNIEGQGAKRAVSYVKMDIGAGNSLSVKPNSYQQLLAKMSQSAVYTPQQQKPKPVPKQPQQQAQVQAPQPVRAAPISTPPPAMPAQQKPAAAPVARQPQPILRMPQITPIQPKPMPRPVQQEIPRPAPKPLERSAAEELQKVVTQSKITPAPQPEQVYKPSSKLVLPTLSLTDQVSELDKIIENLKGPGFTSDQMQIVRDEVVGLSKLIASQQPTASGTLDKDLLELRKTRVAEALSLMGGT